MEHNRDGNSRLTTEICPSEPIRKWDALRSTTPFPSSLNRFAFGESDGKLQRVCSILEVNSLRCLPNGPAVPTEKGHHGGNIPYLESDG